MDRSIVYPWAMFATWWRDKQPPRRAHGVTLSYSLFPGCQRCFSTAKEWETDDVMNGDWNWDSTPRVVPSYSWFLSRMFLCVLWFFCVSSPLTRLEYWVRDSWTTWTCGMICRMILCYGQYMLRKYHHERTATPGTKLWIVSRDDTVGDPLFLEGAYTWVFQNATVQVLLRLAPSSRSRIWTSQVCSNAVCWE